MEFNEIVGKVLAGLAALSIVVEVTPIKINPVSFILRWIGKRTNKELESKVDALSARVDQLEESDAIDCRVRILAFADEIRRGVRHSKETFDQALSDIDTYERYCNAHPLFLNKKTVAANEKIVAVYSDCMGKNDFL